MTVSFLSRIMGSGSVSQFTHRSALQATMQDMSSAGSDLTLLERAVLHAICEAHPVDRAALKGQLSTAIVLSRENTGAGFYTRLATERSCGTPIGVDRLRRGPTV